MISGNRAIPHYLTLITYHFYYVRLAKLLLFLVTAILRQNCDVAGAVRRRRADVCSSAVDDFDRRARLVDLVAS